MQQKLAELMHTFDMGAPEMGESAVKVASAWGRCKSAKVYSTAPGAAAFAAEGKVSGCTQSSLQNRRPSSAEGSESQGIPYR